MIYFNIQAPAPEPASHHLNLVRHNLAVALDKNSRLTGIIGRQAERIAELTADLEDARAENVRLTGQVHALLATLEAAL
jgi:light-regulated signal transduction histidine kinase (bacteriophytochrome)